MRRTALRPRRTIRRIDGMEEVELVEHVYPLSDSAVEKKSPGERTLFAKGDHKLHLKRIDALLMAAVTAGLRRSWGFRQPRARRARRRRRGSPARPKRASVTFDLGAVRALPDDVLRRHLLGVHDELHLYRAVERRA